MLPCDLRFTARDHSRFGQPEVALFDKRAIAEIEQYVDAASLPDDREFAPTRDTFVNSAARPGVGTDSIPFMRGLRRPWLVLLAYVLVIVGALLFFNNAEALMNGDAVECDGSPMRPDQWCVRVGYDGISYAEEKKNEARGVFLGYAGVGLGTLGIALFVGRGIAGLRKGR